jgi:hypothetical protein
VARGMQVGARLRQYPEDLHRLQLPGNALRVPPGRRLRTVTPSVHLATATWPSR